MKWRIAILLYGVSRMGSTVMAQPVYSIDFQGPTIGQSDSATGTAISEGDLLLAGPGGVPSGTPTFPPRIVVFGGATKGGGAHLGLPMYEMPPSGGRAPGVPGLVEVDALSFGADFLLRPESPFVGVWTFSVDEFSAGLSPEPSMPPSVYTEGFFFGTSDGSADVYASFPPGTIPPGPASMPISSNAVLFDGNASASPKVPHPALSALHGLGLVEPNPDSKHTFPDLGDNLDALDVDPPGPDGTIPFPIYYSLDSFLTDPLEIPPMGYGPVNSGSAFWNGFSSSDVLVTPFAGAEPVLYAAASELGLDFIFGPHSDDLDALVLRENGIPGYQVSLAPYDWMDGSTDMLVFSVRRGSDIVGVPDSILGLPIDVGDLLVPPFGGPGNPPGILIAAELLGLATNRGGFIVGDDLNALDVSPDCNVNGVPDRLDIVLGLSMDCDGNQIPDSCESAVPETICDDTIDNDCDGDTDCADADCTDEPTCGACGDKDCSAEEDSCNCAEDCGAPPESESLCNDGIDEDCDKLPDCLDPDCSNDPSCGCTQDPDCDDENACTCDACEMNACVSFPVQYGNSNCTGTIDVDDIVCVLDGFADFSDCPNGDIKPGCAGNNLIDVDDISAVLDAFAGIDPCQCP